MSNTEMDTMHSQQFVEPLRLFVVEDSPHFRAVLAEELQVPGEIEIVGFAESESESIKKLSEVKVDAAIVDLKLKQGSGLGILKYFASLSGRRPRLIVFTNHPFPELKLHCMQLGADYFFDKSVEYDELRKTINALRLAKLAPVN
jgi:DNA-binding NarL/FixJ family response regulator